MAAAPAACDSGVLATTSAPRGEANSTATITRKTPPLSALATPCDAPLIRVPSRFSAATATISPHASTPVETPPASPSRWTYSPNTTEMKALEPTYCSQLSQPVARPTAGPKARRAIG